MNTRPLTQLESKNLSKLNTYQFESVLLFLTSTGYKKSICDATSSIRHFLSKKDIHNFSQQCQGPENKVIKNIFVLHNEGIENSQISLYRPNTKKGDPRLWVSNLRQYTQGDNALAIFVYNENLHIVNLSNITFSNQFIQQYFDTPAQTDISNELLEKLREIAKKPIPATCKGDTAIGRSLEKALGIPINSSRLPDYKGIELKTKRKSSNTRNTLFACVPDWNLSSCKSSAEILERFGYWRDTVFRLYCTVSTTKINSQNLFFSINEVDRLLNELHKMSDGDSPVAVWKLETLEKRLKQKHNETFWIDAGTEKVKGKEYFTLKSIMHTQRPNVPQFERLLSTGDITMDHLIKRKANNRVVEKGPLFKIKSSKIPELFFGKPTTYHLV